MGKHINRKKKKHSGACRTASERERHMNETYTPPNRVGRSRKKDQE